MRAAARFVFWWLTKGTSGTVAPPKPPAEQLLVWGSDELRFGSDKLTYGRIA